MINRGMSRAYQFIKPIGRKNEGGELHVISQEKDPFTIRVIAPE